MGWAELLAGCVVSGVITWGIVFYNRKAAERSAAIRAKNELLRSLERRGLYIWSNMKKGGSFDFTSEVSHIRLDIRRINDKFKELGAVGKNGTVAELERLSDFILPPDIDDLVHSPEGFPPARLERTAEEITVLVIRLMAMPPK